MADETGLLFHRIVLSLHCLNAERWIEIVISSRWNLFCKFQSSLISLTMWEKRQSYDFGLIILLIVILIILRAKSNRSAVQIHPQWVYYRGIINTSFHPSIYLFLTEMRVKRWVFVQTAFWDMGFVHAFQRYLYRRLRNLFFRLLTDLQCFGHSHIEAAGFLWQ